MTNPTSNPFGPFDDEGKDAQTQPISVGAGSADAAQPAQPNQTQPAQTAQPASDQSQTQPAQPEYGQYAGSYPQAPYGTDGTDGAAQPVQSAQSAQPQYGQNAYGQQPAGAPGQPQYGQYDPNGQPQYGQPYVAQPQYDGQNPYTQPYGQPGVPGVNTPYAQPGYGYYPQQRWNGMAIAGFVCSFFVAIVGLILSIIGFNQIKKTGEKGRGLAIAGIIIGGISVALEAIFIFVIIGGIVAGAAEGVSADINVNHGNSSEDYDYSYSSYEEPGARADVPTARVDAIIADAYATVGVR